MSKLDSSTVFCLFWTLCRFYACSHSSRVRSFHSIFPLCFVVIFSPRSLFKHYPPFPLLCSFLCVSLFGTRCFLVMSFCSFFAFKPIHWARFFNIQVCAVSMCITVWHIHTYHYVSFCSIQFLHFSPQNLPPKVDLCELTTAPLLHNIFGISDMLCSACSAHSCFLIGRADVEGEQSLRPRCIHSGIWCSEKSAPWTSYTKQRKKL